VSDIFCPILNKFGDSRRNFVTFPIFKLHGNPSSGIRAVTCGQTDRQSDVMQLIGASRNLYARAPEYKIIYSHFTNVYILIIENTLKIYHDLKLCGDLNYGSAPELI
jgi:hypothetical protein